MLYLQIAHIKQFTFYRLPTNCIACYLLALLIVNYSVA